MLETVQWFLTDFFADDALFFLKASEENCLCMRSILDYYCFASSQEANLEKSRIFFSVNSSVEVKDMVCDVLGVASSPSPGVYLGLPAIWERSKCNALSFIKDRMARKIQGWKGRFLSGWKGSDDQICGECCSFVCYELF